jgi:hypothetical protein
MLLELSRLFDFEYIKQVFTQTRFNKRQQQNVRKNQITEINQAAYQSSRFVFEATKKGK